MSKPADKKKDKKDQDAFEYIAETHTSEPLTGEWHKVMHGDSLEVVFDQAHITFPYSLADDWLNKHGLGWLQHMDVTDLKNMHSDYMMFSIQGQPQHTVRSVSETSGSGMVVQYASMYARYPHGAPIEMDLFLRSKHHPVNTGYSVQTESTDAKLAEHLGKIARSNNVQVGTASQWLSYGQIRTSLDVFKSKSLSRVSKVQHVIPSTISHGNRYELTSEIPGKCKIVLSGWIIVDKGVLHEKYPEVSDVPPIERLQRNIVS